jgi:hypothetical protein
MVTSTGKGLNVLIRAEYSFSSNWMSFGSWYSVQKNLPDANVAIVCDGVSELNNISGCFVWTGKFGVNVFKCENFDDFFIKLFDRKNCNLFDLPLLILDKGVLMRKTFCLMILLCF